MDFANNTVLTPPLSYCLFLELSNGNYDCASEPGEFNRTVCIWCPVTKSFFTGESLDDIGSPGHVVVMILGVLAFLVGTFGFFGNLLIILILRRQKSGRVFDTMLSGLAVFDLMWSVSSLISAITGVIYLQNWDRGMSVVCFIKSHYFALFCRTGSSFMTILIAFERYMAVSRPVMAAAYITPTRVRIAVICTAVFSVLMGIPRFTSSYMSVSMIRHNVSTAEDMEDLVTETHFGKFWQEVLDGVVIVTQIDYLLPLPLLLLFNGLTYREIEKIIQRRKEITTSERKELSAAEMFCPVVGVLAICYIVPAMNYFFTFIQCVMYWEMMIGTHLSFVVNAAANLPIYYCKGAVFKMEAKRLFNAYKIRRTQSEKSTSSLGSQTLVTTQMSRSLA